MKYFKPLHKNVVRFHAPDGHEYMLDIDFSWSKEGRAKVFKRRSNQINNNAFIFDGFFTLEKRHGQLSRCSTIKKFFDDYKQIQEFDQEE